MPQESDQEVVELPECSSRSVGQSSDKARFARKGTNHGTNQNAEYQTKAFCLDGTRRRKTRVRYH
jgi:hypothetical protein